jgi:hypothetical protein
MTLSVLANQHTEPDARTPVTLIAELVQANDFHFHASLCTSAGGPSGATERHGSERSSC